MGTSIGRPFERLAGAVTSWMSRVDGDWLSQCPVHLVAYLPRGADSC